MSAVVRPAELVPNAPNCDGVNAATSVVLRVLIAVNDNDAILLPKRTIFAVPKPIALLPNNAICAVVNAKIESLSSAAIAADVSDWM